MQTLETRGLMGAVFVFAAVSVTWASITGSISGIVKDPSGAVVPNATVTVTNLGTGIKQAVQTDALGSYTLLSLSVGRYQLEINRQGFEGYQLREIVLNANDVLRFDVVLQVGATKQSIEVPATAVQVETANTQMGDVVSGGHMEALPLNGRAYTDLIGLQPGVAPDSAGTVGNGFPPGIGTKTEGNLSIGGQRETANGFRVNGGDVASPLGNSASVVPNLDAMAEFRLLTNNYDAEYGRYSGGIINAVTKSGGNEWHGDAFEFLRNQHLDARNFFDINRGDFRRNQFGGVLGGPINRDKAFFFVDYQGTRETRALSSGEVLLPSAAERSGTFDPSLLSGAVKGNFWARILSQRLGYTVINQEPYSSPGCTSTTGPGACVFPGGAIPQSAFSSPAKGILPFILSPNVGSFFVGLNSTHTRDDRGGIRVDGNSRWGMLSAYYFVADVNQSNAFGGNPMPGFPTATFTRAQQLNLGDTKSLGGTAVNELRLNYTRSAGHSLNPAGGFGKLSSFGFQEGPGTLGLVWTNPPNDEGVPFVAFNNFSIGLPGSWFNAFQNTVQLLDNYSRVRGKHTIKFGGEFEYAQFSQRLFFPPNFFFAGGETGIDFADFLLGAPDFFFEISPDQGDGRTHYLGFYAQDSWRVRRTLTLNYGLRWEVSQPWYDTQNRVTTYIAGEQSQVYPTAPRGYDFPGDPGVARGLSPTRYDNFGPRIGLAYSPSASGGVLGRVLGPGTTSIRASYGVFYVPVEDEQQFFTFGEPPFLLFYPSPVPLLFETPFVDRATGNSEGQRFPFRPIPKHAPRADFSPFLPIASDGAFATNNRLPYVEQYSFSLQRQLGSHDLLSVSYVGNQAHRLLANVQPHPGIPQTCLFLSNSANLATSQVPCGPFLEDATYTLASGTVIQGTRGPQYPPSIQGTAVMYTMANSNYNALEISWRHTSGPLTFLAGYTYSKSIDNASSDVDRLVYPFNFRLARALSAFDNTHNFVMSYSYLLPFHKLASGRWPRLTDGWRITGITRFATGFPITLSEADDHALLRGGAFQGEDRPDFAGGNPQAGLHDPRSGLPYFDSSLFSPEQIGQFGTASYRFFDGPGINSFDFGVLKDVALKEQKRLEFRAEFFNLFNHAQFINPSGSINSGTFGVVTSARDPRIGQVAIKFLF